MHQPHPRPNVVTDFFLVTPCGSTPDTGMRFLEPTLDWGEGCGIVWVCVELSSFYYWGLTATSSLFIWVKQ